MPHITPSRPNAYSGSPLDRATVRRDDVAWLAAAFDDADSLWLPIWRGQTLLRGAEVGRPAAVFLAGAGVGAAAQAWAFLGLLQGRPVFAADLSHREEPAALVGEAGEGAFMELRPAAGLLAPAEAAMLAHARGLMHWRTHNRFCGNCGAATEPRHAGNTMLCPRCGTQHFPRTDPAVIMLVTRGERALLGHSPRFPAPRMYSTLAGFVEPGETLEEAVAREVLEECGVRVGRVVYHSSQPWPFPASIMLGFYAEALSEEITIDRDELSDARWFTRAEIREPEAYGFSIPRRDSIASRLIEDWMEAA